MTGCPPIRSISGNTTRPSRSFLGPRGGWNSCSRRAVIVGSYRDQNHKSIPVLGWSRYGLENHQPYSTTVLSSCHRKIKRLPGRFGQPEGMRGAIARYPDHFLPHAKQGPAVAGTLRKFDVDEEIRELHLMPIHAQRLEAIPFLADAQLQRIRDALRID